MLFDCLKISVLAAFVWMVPELARARLNPTPPPSGIVVHLFGPGSIMDNVLPQTAAPPAPPRPVAGVGSAAPSAGSEAGTGTPAAAPAYAAPSMGGILHQMFVTGDPNDPQKPSAGRTVERP